jgi:hypothetical protein
VRAALEVMAHVHRGLLLRRNAALCHLHMFPLMRRGGRPACPILRRQA